MEFKKEEDELRGIDSYHSSCECLITLFTEYITPRNANLNAPPRAEYLSPGCQTRRKVALR